MAGLALFGLASLQDIAFRLVPNAVPLAIAAVGVATRLIDGTLPRAAMAALVVFAIAAFCWRRGWLGGADVKLFASGALLVPPAAVFAFVLASCLAGGVLAVCYGVLGALARMRPAASSGAHPPQGMHPPGFRRQGKLRRLIRIERRRLCRGGPLPYAVAVSAGACCILLQA